MTLQSERDAEFARFVAANAPSLLRSAFLLTGQQAAAEDVLQNTLVRLYRSWDRLDTSTAPLGYARRILYTTHVSMWRSRLRELLPGVLPDARDLHDDYAVHDERDRLWRLVCLLPRMQRSVVVLRFYEGLTEAEIAQVLEIAPGSVKTHSARGLRRLRELEGDSRTGTHPTGSAAVLNTELPR